MKLALKWRRASSFCRSPWTATRSTGTACVRESVVACGGHLSPSCARPAPDRHEVQQLPSARLQTSAGAPGMAIPSYLPAMAHGPYFTSARWGVGCVVVGDDFWACRDRMGGGGVVGRPALWTPAPAQPASTSQTPASVPSQASGPPWREATQTFGRRC